MKNIATVLSFLLAGILNADTHGGVRVANAQFKAAVHFAFAQAEDLDRVLKVEKIQDSGSCSLFQIVSGGQNSQTGIVSPSSFSFLKVTSPDDNGTISTDPDKQVVEESQSLPNCK
jgi:hypothetical protein